MQQNLYQTPFDLIVSPFLLIPVLIIISVFLLYKIGFSLFSKLPSAFAALFKSRADNDAQGEISPLLAFLLSLSSSVGVGNILGAATAITLSGAGAVFWMWIGAVFALSIRFCEVALSVRYRKVNSDGEILGGAMYYIKYALDKKWHFLGIIFALGGVLSAFLLYNMAQVNIVSSSLVGLSDGFFTGAHLAVLLLIAGALAVTGGIKQISSLVALLIPPMIIIYTLCAAFVLGLNFDKTLDAFGAIFKGAFDFNSLLGGFGGLGVAMVIQHSLSYGFFTSDSGLGSASMAHSYAQTKEPIKQALISAIEPFLDTIILSTVTALMILTFATIDADAKPFVTLSAAFREAYGSDFGINLLAITLIVFSFSTFVPWCIYGERCAAYLLGAKIKPIFRIVFTLVIPLGIVADTSLLLNLSRISVLLMIIPNVIALLLLSPIIAKMSREYFKSKLKTETENIF